MDRNCLNFSHMSEDPRAASKCLADYLCSEVYPLMLGISNKVKTYSGALINDDFMKLQAVYTLCTSQIKKCIQTLFEVFKIEIHKEVFLRESRQCTFERLSWCVNKLVAVDHHLDGSKRFSTGEWDTSNDSLLATPMYFVNWIDHTFDILIKLSNVIYQTDYKDNNEIYDQWKSDVVDCMSTLHISIDELLLSAMTLCRHCLPADQLIIKARCQVVLRETKALLSELIEGDLDMAFRATTDSLKLPIMPSNVNVLIDVLKDVLYVLETNTNTALLALLVHCFSNSQSPVDALKDHYVTSKATCSCQVRNDDVMEDCSFVKEFDSYNERLLQIGSFAISCSSDQSRILSLRSGLATLEALDPHLVPALMLSPHSHHSKLLMNSWRQEVKVIRDNVFLIVDPAAFAEKSKQMMHQTLLEIMKHNIYTNSNVCEVINIGCVVYDFFSVYNKFEPDALIHLEALVPLLADLNKVQMECKIVSNFFCSGDDFVYNVNKGKTDKGVSIDQLLKRLKLLYTLVNRINGLLHPKDNEDQLFDDLEEQECPVAKNITHTICGNNINNAYTYVNSPRKATNISRSIFARTTNLRSSTTNFPLAKLTMHLKEKQHAELNFSMKLSELFNFTNVYPSNNHSEIVNKKLESIREPSILYNFSPKKRSSLRKAVLSKHCKLPFEKELASKNIGESSTVSVKGDFIDDTTSLQITDILNQINEITCLSSKSTPSDSSSAMVSLRNQKTYNKTTDDTNILSININDSNTITSKHIWNIPVNASTMDDSAATMASNITAPSNVTTLERINDIDLVESKLGSLKLELETSL